MIKQDDTAGSLPNTADHRALQLMLTYLEMECRRLGALEAAHHVAQAALVVPGGLAATHQPPAAMHRPH